MLNTDCRLVPTTCTAPMITIAMSDAISAYSIADTADSSRSQRMNARAGRAPIPCARGDFRLKDWVLMNRS
ncbi:hypothetical protein DP56_6098 [Burkholderia pseudomallei]|nr:hypothetical protein DP56_6098 [Burkholderia pseudomallei]KGD31567.1 hypothetical protein DP59_5947 [Burkholderia pseudomallei]